MTNVGNLNATLTLSQFEFNAGLKQSETAAMEFASTVEMQSRRADQALDRLSNSPRSNMLGKLAQPAQQFGYMIQDFSSQIETRGLGGAIGAITNNVQMLGAAFGPVGMAISSIGGAVAGLVLPKMIDWLSNTQQLNKEAKELEDNYKRVAEQTKFIAKIEMQGGAEQARKELDERIELNRRERQEASQSLIKQENKLQRMRDEYEKMLMFKIPATSLTPEIPFAKGSGSEMRQLMIDISYQKSQVEEQRKHMQELTKEAQDSQEKIFRLKPEVNSNIKLKEDEEKALKQYDLEKKLDADRREAAAALERKSLMEFGTAQQKTDAKIIEERGRLDMLGVSKETKARFEAQAAVLQKRAFIEDQQKHIAELEQPARMSAGALRESAAGVQAINRATSGTASEQSIAKEQLKTAKDQLKALEEIARKPPAVTTFSMSG